MDVITTLKSQFDTFPNLYDISIILPSISNDTPDAEKSSFEIGATPLWNVRASSVTFPELTVGTYSVAYKGVELSRPNSEITGERKLSIKFRLDSDYTLYKLLLKWKRNYGRDSGDGEILDILDNATFNGYLGTIIVYGLKPKEILDSGTNNGLPDYGNTGPKWTFTKVACTKVGTLSFARESSAIIELDAQFIFTKYTIGQGSTSSL